MGEINYDFNLLFRNEKRAESFFTKLQQIQEDTGYELIALVNRCCNSDVESHGFEFDIGDTKRFRNEIRIACYTGRSSEMPDAIVGPLCAAGAEIFRMSVFYEDAPDWDSVYYVDGEKTAKKTYDKQFKQIKVEDTTDQLQRLLDSNRFVQASEIVDDCELDRILPEHEYLAELISSHKHCELAIKLLHAGLYDQPTGDYKSPWLPIVVVSGSTTLLREFLDYGMDPYDTGEYGGNTTLHYALYDAEEYWRPNLELLIDRCANNLNPVTEDGSPLWFGYEQQSNIAACVMMRDAGGEVIPPEAFYEKLEGKALVIEAVKHGDVEAAKTHLNSDNYYDALYWALRHQNFDLVLWLNDLAAIDWCDSAEGKIKSSDIMDEFLTVIPLYEIPFFLNKGPNCDPRLLNFIIDEIPPNRAHYSRLLIYVSGMNYLPEVRALLQKLLELGADIDAHSAINGDPDVTGAADHAMLHECLDNMEFLLQAGINTVAGSLPNGESLSDWLDGYEGDTKRRGKALFQQYGVT